MSFRFDGEHFSLALASAFYRFSGSRLYSAWNGSFRSPLREARTAGVALKGDAPTVTVPAGRLPFPFGCSLLSAPPSLLPPQRVATDSTLVGTTLGFEGLGRSMQRYHGNQTRRPPPLPTVHSTVGRLRSAFENATVPR